MEIIVRGTMWINKNCRVQIDVYVFMRGDVYIIAITSVWGGHARPVCAVAGVGRRVEARVPYTTVICCWRVKLFNPGGINHSWARPKFMHRSRARMQAANIRAAPSRKDRSPHPSCPGVPRRHARTNPAGSDSEDGATRFSPAIPWDLRNSIFRDRVLFPFFSANAINFVARCPDPAVCINNCNRRSFFQCSAWSRYRAVIVYRMSNQCSRLYVTDFYFCEFLIRRIRKLNEILL